VEEVRQLAHERVTANRELSPGVFLLTVTRREAFIPGQVVAVTTAAGIPPRLYSIASGTADQGIDLLFNVVPRGELTPRLAGLRPGDTLLVSTPFGAFRDAGAASVWVAAGTGVAPFRSMARSGCAADRMLVHGSRRLSSLHFRDFFRDVLGERYAPCCTAEEAEGVFKGRVTGWLSASRPSGDMSYLVCGSAEMVVDTRELLITAGVPYAKVWAEIYF
jgi:ferredoxin/flavodoxin---NADP+ reductase